MKKVVITGVSRGLGKALASELLNNNYRVIGTSTSGEADFKHENLHLYQMNLLNKTSVNRFCHEIKSSFNDIDFVINNAGINPKDSKDRDYFLSTYNIQQFSAENTNDSLIANALMPMQIVSNLLPNFTEQTSVLNISSWLGSIRNKTAAGHYGYCGSKTLLNMFTKALAIEWGSSNKSAVAINPGWMKTDMGGSNSKLLPQTVASALLNLMESDLLKKYSGEFIDIDGTLHAW